MTAGSATRTPRALTWGKPPVEAIEFLLVLSIAYDTDEAVQRIIDITIGNIAAFEAGRPQNVVTSSGESS